MSVWPWHVYIASPLTLIHSHELDVCLIWLITHVPPHDLVSCELPVRFCESLKMSVCPWHVYIAMVTAMVIARSVQ